MKDPQACTISPPGERSRGSAAAACSAIRAATAFARRLDLIIEKWTKIFSWTEWLKLKHHGVRGRGLRRQAGEGGPPPAVQKRGVHVRSFELVLLFRLIFHFESCNSIFQSLNGIKPLFGDHVWGSAKGCVVFLA